MKNQPIGIIDSGVGGLSVWQEIVALLPDESTIYLSDQKNIPYGTKNKNEIYLLAEKMVKFVLGKKIKLLIIACNTITVSSLDKLRMSFPQIPIIGVVPVVKTAAEISKSGRIGIISTIATANSKPQKELIRKYASNCFVMNKGTDILVPLVENGEVNGEKIYSALRKVLQPFIDANIDVLALGCTHFPFLKDAMKQLVGDKIILLDSGTAVARHTKRILEKNDILSRKEKPEYRFYTTGDADKFELVMGRLVGEGYSGKINWIESIML